MPYILKINVYFLLFLFQIQTIKTINWIKATHGRVGRWSPGGHGLHVVLRLLKHVGAGVRGDGDVRGGHRRGAQVPHLVLEKVIVLVGAKVLCVLPEGGRGGERGGEVRSESFDLD